MSCFLDSIFSKVIDVVWDKAIVPVGRQFKYVFCYKSYIADMNAVDHDLENNKKLIEQSVHEGDNNLQVITDMATEWLQKVEEAHQEAGSLFSTYEKDQATRSSCIGQILNPIARHQLGRNATKKKQTIEELLQNKPQPGDIYYKPEAPGIVNEETAAAQHISNDVTPSSSWNEP